MKDAVNFQQLQSHPLAPAFHRMRQTLEALGGGVEFTEALNELSSLSDAVEAEVNSAKEAENIADAVISLLVDRGLLDAGNEYRAAEVSAALEQLFET